MTVGLLAPLSPQEEIALRRVALGSFVVDAQAASRLIGMVLLQRTSSGLRLTPLGQRHFNAHRELRNPQSRLRVRQWRALPVLAARADCVS